MEQPINFVALIDHLSSMRTSVLQPILPWPITITADDPNPLQHYCANHQDARPKYGSMVPNVLSSITGSQALHDVTNAPVSSGDSLPTYTFSNMQAPLSIPEISRLLSSFTLPNAENNQHAARSGSKLAAAVIAEQLVLHDCRVSQSL